MNINFDTGYMSKEEATGLRALLDAINGTLPTASELRESHNRMNGAYGQIGLGPAVAQKVFHDAVTTGTGTMHVKDDGSVDAVELKSDEPKRERGKPAPGKQRRTKEEIAEDEAAEKAEASGTQAISTGGERVSPEDDAEVQEQDKADEQAEVEASRNPEKPLTVDDVRTAVGLYVDKHGMAATNEDGPAIFVKALGKPPEGNPFWKLSILPDDQDKLKACVDEWAKAASSDKRYGA